MKSVLFFFILLTTSVFAQKFEPVPRNPQEIVRFRQSFTIADDDSLINFKLTGDDKLFLLSAQKIQILDARSTQVLESSDNKIPKVESLVRFYAISPDGQKTVSLDPEDRRLTKIRKLLSKKEKLAAIVWDLKTSARLATLEGETKSIRHAVWSENAKTLVTMSDWLFGEAKETEVCFWKAENFAQRNCQLIDGHFGWSYPSKDGKRFFAAVSNVARNWIIVWDTENSRILHRFEAPGGIWGYSSAFLSPNQNLLAITTLKSIEFWELDNFTKKFEINLPRKSSWMAFGSFSPDEKYVAVKNGKNGTEIYETETGKLKFSIPQNKSVPDIWAANGKVLISSYCGEAMAYSLETADLLYKLKLVCKTATDLVSTSVNDEDEIILHPGTRYFLTGSGTAVRIWNAATGELLQTIVNPAQEAEKRKNPRADDKIKGRTTLWSGDGKYLYVPGNDEKSVLQYEFTGK
jgi:WD40 repeat protein